jgi:hypothetical protein
MNFMHRDGWSLHILAEDCRIALVGYRSVHDQETLLRIVAKLKGNPAHAAEDIRRWGRGSVRIASGINPKALFQQAEPRFGPLVSTGWFVAGSEGCSSGLLPVDRQCGNFSP